MLFHADNVSLMQFPDYLSSMQKVASLNSWLVTTFQSKTNTAKFLGTRFRTWLVSAIIRWSEINMETSSAW
jgi:hypothetical protein